MNLEKYSCQYTRSNTMNGDFGQITKDQNMCRQYKLLQHLVKISLNQYNFKAIFTKSTISEDLYDAP